MCCSECGERAHGKFCSHCGARLQTADSATTKPEVVGRIGDWSQEVRHEVLMQVPEVRAAIERHARLAKKGLTGEQVLELYEKLVPIGIPMAKLVGIIAPLYSKWGINTGKERTGNLDMCIGHAIVQVLCSLAEHGQTVRGIEQAEDGCTIIAELPSDVRSLQGDLTITLRRDGNRTQLYAATRIKGQWMDWGKSRNTLDKLFSDLERKAV